VLTAQHTDDGVEKKRRFLSASIMMMVIITVMSTGSSNGWVGRYFQTVQWSAVQ